jgi:hypothetical protein
MSSTLDIPESPTLRQYPPINTINHGNHSNKTQQEHIARYDLKFGGQNNDRIAFIRGRDIWVADFYGNERQLTQCAAKTDDPTLMCGVAEFVMQVR